MHLTRKHINALVATIDTSAYEVQDGVQLTLQQLKLLLRAIKLVKFMNGGMKHQGIFQHFSESIDISKYRTGIADAGLFHFLKAVFLNALLHACRYDRERDVFSGVDR